MRCLQMSSSDSKHVQTELSPETYKQFRELARERGLTVKEAGRTALVEWIERQLRPDPNDPAFTILDELERIPTPKSAETDARTEDDIVTEWEGSNVKFKLAKDPLKRPESADG